VFKRSATFLFVIAFALAGCAGTPATPSAAESAAPVGSSPSAAASAGAGAPTGKITTVATTLAGAGQDVILTSLHDFKNYWDEVFDWVIDQDATGKLVPGLASSWEPSADHLTWIFTIRDGVKFHNGDTLTAEDVAWSWNRIIFDPASKHILVGYAPNVDSITADGNKVLFKTKEPDATLPLVWAKLSGTQGAIHSKKYFEKVGAEEAFRHPVGTGPYMFVKQDGEQSVDLTAFLDDGRSEWQKERTAGFKDLTITAVPDPSTRVALLKTGGADVVPLPISSIEEVKGAGLTVDTVPGANYSVAWCLGFTLNPESPCNKREVREALSIAIDRQGIADSLYAGLAVPSNAFYSGPGSYGNPKDLTAPPFEPDRAKELLASVGYTAENPLKVELRAYEDDADFPSLPTMVEAIAAGYRDIGIDASIAINDWGAHEDIMEKGELPGMRNNPAVTPVTLWIRGSDNRYDFAAEQLSGYTAVGKKGKAAWDNTVLKEQQDRLDAVANEFDLAKREVLFADYHKWMGENFNHLPLLAADAVFGVSSKVASWDLRVAGKTYVHNQWSMKPAS
jgi:peptide/nickel transport system substrate-binding protein